MTTISPVLLPSKAAPAGPRGRCAFTLIELLFVLAIIGIVAAVTVPNIVQSIRGHRIRVATRTIVMAGRYARSMAVLRQEPVKVTFDLAAGRVDISSDRASDVALSRVLEGVSIDSVRSGEDEPVTEGQAHVVYQTNGRCAPYTVRIEDREGGRVVIAVDALAGAVTERL